MAPPAGFEPAHTAPECIAQQSLDPRKRDTVLVARALSGGGLAEQLPCTAAGWLPGEPLPGRLQPLPRMPGPPALLGPRADPAASYSPGYCRSWPVSGEEFPLSVEVI